MKFVSEDDDESVLELLPPLSAAELDSLQASLPAPLPEEIRDLLSFARGFEGGPLDVVDFSGSQISGSIWRTYLVAHFRCRRWLRNFWAIDVTASSPAWNDVFYVCHDAPVVVYQTNSLVHFIQEVLRMGKPPYNSEIGEVHDEMASRIDDENPDLITVDVALTSHDATLRTFAESLDPEFQICDMRARRMGDGFKWGDTGRIQFCDGTATS